VRLPPSWPDQVDVFLTAGDEELGDQAPVAAGPESLGAHQARSGLRQRLRERALPGVGSHPGGVAAERSDPDAAKALLAGLAAAPAAELLGVPVGDAGLPQRLRERGLPELRVAP
jgi:hypothetical protein